MIRKLNNIFLTATFKQSGITIVGTVLSAVLGWLFYILTARYLGPENYGIFSVATTTLALAVSVLNVGTDTGVVRFVGKYINTNKNKALQYLYLGFKVKVVSSAVAVLIGILFGNFIAVNLLNKSELSMPITVALIGSGITLLYNFSSSAVQALQKFVTWSFMLIINNFFRVIIFAVVALVGFATLENTLAIFVLSPLIGFLIGMFIIPKFLFIKGGEKITQTFYGYNKWIAIFSVITAVSARLDTLITARYLSLSEVGIYSVAVGLSSLVVQIVLALGTVIAPKLAQFRNNTEAKEYIKKVQLLVLGLAFIGLVVGVPFAYFIIPIIYGPEFSASFTPFVILLIGQAVFLISVPVHNAILYYFSKPKLFVYLSIVHLIFIALAGTFLISRMGMIGAGITVTVGMVINFVIPAVWVVNKFKEK